MAESTNQALTPAAVLRMLSNDQSIGLRLESFSETSRSSSITTPRASIETPAISHAAALVPRLTVERLAYAIVFVLAVLTRYWDLGSRALHHDESEHAYYSWVYAQGGGYVHDPLLHGPFLFHANALITLLFGSTDASARFVPAAAGVAIVMLPWLLRGPRLLGRWGALCASVFLLLSPSILYYSRFIRHDVYTLIGTFLLFIAVVRYVEVPAPRWLMLGAAATGFLTTTKEVCFIVFFIFGVFLLISAAWRIAPILLAIGAAAGAVFLAIARSLSFFGVRPLPSIPWTNPTGAQVRTFAFDLLTHPLVISAIVVGLAAVAVALGVLHRRVDPERGWIETFTGDAPRQSTAAAIGAALSDRRMLLIAIITGLSIYVVLYTSLFTNPMGLASGSVGALGYWLGQQGVQRGQEPWFYYLLLVPQYEFIGVILFPIAVVILAKDTLLGWRRRLPFDHHWWMRVFLVVWAAMMFAVLSWAGEKMPWLTVHIALPLILLSGALAGDAVNWFERRWRAGGRVNLRPVALFGGALLTTCAFGFALITWMSNGPTTGSGPMMVQQVRPVAAGHWWLLLSLPIIAVAAIVILGFRRLGPRAALSVILVTLTLGLLVLQVHTEWRLTYREGDVPKDMLIYVQTSPYVPQLTNELRQLSLMQNGNMSLNIWYDDITSWPFQWYLRDFTGKQYFGNSLSADVNAPVVLIGSDNMNAANTAALQSHYTMREYPMRWWFPEDETYRHFAYAPDIKQVARQNEVDSRPGPYSPLDVAGSVWRTLASMRHPQEQGKIFRLVAYHDLPAQVHSTNFRVYIRNDLVPEFDAIRYRSGE